MYEDFLAPTPIDMPRCVCMYVLVACTNYHLGMIGVFLKGYLLVVLSINVKYMKIDVVKQGEVKWVEWKIR